MGFDVTALFPGVVFQASTDGVEGIADGDVDVFMGLVLSRFFAHYDLALRYRDIDLDMKDIALVFVLVWNFYYNTTAHDMFVKATKLFGALTDIGLDCLRWFHVTKGNFYW